MNLRVGDRFIDCTNRTAVMAILNIATDSPVAESVVAVDDALRRSAGLREAGAEIIDVGAHSTRTGGESVSEQAEIDRVCPVIEALCGDGQIVSVDTWSGRVAAAAAQAGAHVLNDVTGGSDAEMARVARDYALPLIVMHMRGQPKQHREADQTYEDVGAEVRVFLADRIATLSKAGVDDIWIDPGFEFAKSAADNVRMLQEIPSLRTLERPVVISASRKSFLAELLGHPKMPSNAVQAVPGLVEATLAFNVLAANLGVHIVRVHDVAAIAPAIRLVNSVRAVSTESA
jgi:dihydropteroate synthase